MAPRNTIHSFLSLALIVPMMLLALLGACSKSKKTGVDAAGAAPIQSSSDASATGSEDEESSTALEDCDEEKEVEDEAKDEAEVEAEDEDGEAALKEKDKGNKVKKECPVPGTTPATPAATTGTASLAEGQKIYTASCQGCHGALPGQKQGASAQSILGASGVGAHKGVTPWPAGPGSALSAQDAAASLAAAMK